MGLADNVVKNIKDIYEQRRVKLYALALDFAGRAINIARQDKNWTDQTGQAVARMFARAFIDGDEIGFFLSHGVFYGIYLELANDRKYAIIKPVIEELGPEFIKQARALY
jgi:hypothetical protein